MLDLTSYQTSEEHFYGRHLSGPAGLRPVKRRKDSMTEGSKGDRACSARSRVTLWQATMPQLSCGTTHTTPHYPTSPGQLASAGTGTVPAPYTLRRPRRAAVVPATRLTEPGTAHVTTLAKHRPSCETDKLTTLFNQVSVRACQNPNHT
jgi:hypothetical protein